MTIEELSIAATDKENFSHEGEVIVQDALGVPHKVMSVYYHDNLKQLVITVEAAEYNKPTSSF